MYSGEFLHKICKMKERKKKLITNLILGLKIREKNEKFLE